MNIITAEIRLKGDTSNELEKIIDALEEKYDAEFLRAHVKNGVVRIELIKGPWRVKGYKAYISVWNLTPTLIIEARIGRKAITISEDDIDFTDEERTELKEMEEKVVIPNFSGIYPLSDELREWLEKRIEKIEAAIKSKASNGR